MNSVLGTHGTGHLVIHLRNDDLCVPAGCLDIIDGDAETAIAVFIGRGDMDDRHIHGKRFDIEHGRQLMKIAGVKIGSTAVDGFAGCCVNKG